jgi:predicted kinase
MSKVIKSINLLSIYDNEDFHLVDFDYMQKYHNTSRNDLKNRYISMTLNFTDNTVININAECNGNLGDYAWIELFDDKLEAIIGTEFVDVIETDENINVNMHEGQICKLVYNKNNKIMYYDFKFCSNVDDYYYGHSVWIELIPDYQVDASNVFEKDSIILLVGLPGAGKTTYLKNYLSNPNYLLLDDYHSYSSLNVDNNPNIDWHDNKIIGLYNQKTKKFTDSLQNYYADDWEHVTCNGINFNTRKQIHNWLRNDKNNKVIIADAKFCNEGYYNYAIRMLNVYNKQEVIQTILFNTDSETCEERLKLRGTSFKYFYNSLLEFSNIYNVNNSCYINPNIYYDINSILYVI